MNDNANITVGVRIVRQYKRNTLVELRVNGGQVHLDEGYASDVAVNPRYFNGTVRLMVPNGNVQRVLP